jgi:hypothetical protein
MKAEQELDSMILADEEQESKVKHELIFRTMMVIGLLLISWV